MDAIIELFPSVGPLGMVGSVVGGFVCPVGLQRLLVRVWSLWCVHEQTIMNPYGSFIHVAESACVRGQE